MFDLNKEYETITKQYKTNIGLLLDRAAKDGMNGVALGDHAVPAIVPSPKRTVTRRDPKPTPKIRTKAKASGKKARAPKRSDEELKVLEGKILAHLAEHPGEGVEKIGTALKTDTKELALPIKRMLAARVITKRGQKRASVYFPKA